MTTEPTLTVDNQLTLTPPEEPPKVEVDLALHQEQRSALGKQMGLDVGPPNEKVVLANSRVTNLRDGLGILLDARVYASRKCNTCYGCGVVTATTHVSDADAKKMLAQNPANEALLHEREPGKYDVRTARMCNCSRKRYDKLHDAFLEALHRAGLVELWRPFRSTFTPVCSTMYRLV